MIKSLILKEIRREKEKKERKRKREKEKHRHTDRLTSKANLKIPDTCYGGLRGCAKKYHKLKCDKGMKWDWGRGGTNV